MANNQERDQYVEKAIADIVKLHGPNFEQDLRKVLNDLWEEASLDGYSNGYNEAENEERGLNYEDD